MSKLSPIRANVVLPLLMLALGGCTTAPGIRANWYLFDPAPVREDDTVPRDVYVVIQNPSLEPITIQSLEWGPFDGEGSTPVRGFAATKLAPGALLTFRTGLVGNTGKDRVGEFLKKCQMPAWLSVRINENDKMQVLPLTGQLPSTLPNEWLACPNSPTPAPS